MRLIVVLLWNPSDIGDNGKVYPVTTAFGFAITWRQLRKHHLSARQRRYGRESAATLRFLPAQ